ncbi:hypothetical protein FB451DRAFT_1201817 [Mycena latifolia]|nr:hypothetical protein FB451DRAFT_1201817 [Mycena latifolia]
MASASPVRFMMPPNATQLGSASARYDIWWWAAGGLSGPEAVQGAACVFQGVHDVEGRDGHAVMRIQNAETRSAPAEVTLRGTHDAGVCRGTLPSQRRTLLGCRAACARVRRVVSALTTDARVAWIQPASGRQRLGHVKRR